MIPTETLLTVDGFSFELNHVQCLVVIFMCKESNYKTELNTEQCKYLCLNLERRNMFKRIG